MRKSRRRIGSSRCSTIPIATAAPRKRRSSFKLITEAYDVLRDGNKRAVYDRYGEEGLRGRGNAGMHHVDLSEALGIFMRDFGGFSGFEEMFGGGSRGNQRSGADVKITMPLTLPEVMIGVEKKIVVKLLDPCERCDGSGAEPGTKPQRCSTCAGSGEVRRAQRSFFGQFVSVAPCPTCAGQGKTIEIPCKRCKGEGRSRAEHTITVPIPAGVATGQYLMLRGQGSIGPLGGPRGDILVAFEVEDDPRFERDGADLYTEVLVTYWTARVGRRCAGAVHHHHAFVAGAAGYAERSGLPAARTRTSARERIGLGRPSGARAAVDAAVVDGGSGGDRSRAARERGTAAGDSRRAASGRA